MNGLLFDTCPRCSRWGVLLLGFVLTACNREQVQVYRVPKDQPQAAAQQAAAHNHEHESQLPRVSWKLPAGWEEVEPGEMRAASFRILGKNGKTADVGIVPLPGLAGKDLDNVNRWRGQVGLPPVKEEELAKLSAQVEIAGQPALLFDQVGENPSSGEKGRILAAILRRDGVAWFFKASGDNELVASQKQPFIDFLKSVQFASEGTSELPPDHPPIGGMQPGMAQATAESSGAHPAWKVPGDWKEVPGGQFLVAKFMVGPEKAPAAVNVSSSAGDGGGVAGNVNRWRKQLGLEELSEAQLKDACQDLDIGGGKATLVEMTGTDARTSQKAALVGAIVPAGGQTWFFKLMGDPETVAGEKAAFRNFIQSADYSHAP